MTGGDVPRETSALSEVEQQPASALELFGDRLDVAEKFAQDLVELGGPLGLIGPQEHERLWTRHLINSALLGPLIGPGTVADVGSGAGLPGLVLAIVKPSTEFVLIEPMQRRAEWLRDEARRLELTNVVVERARAQEVGRLRFDQVTARAVSSLSKLIPMTAPLAIRGGQLVFLKGARVRDEVESARSQITRFHLGSVETLMIGEGLADQGTWVFRATVDRPSRSASDQKPG